jgi:hypothetical protein
MKKFLIISLSLLVILISGSLFTFYFTPVPINFIVKILNSMHVQTEGMTGTLASGLKIKKISFGEKDNHFEMEDFSFHYSGLWDYYIKKELNISEVEIGKMVVKLTTEINKTTQANPNQPVPTQSPVQPKFEAVNFPKELFKKVIISKIDIRNVTIDFNLFPESLVLDQLEVLDWTNIDHKVEFTKFLIESNAFSLALEKGLNELTEKSSPTATEKSVKLTLKPTYLKRLKAPINFEGHIRIDDGKFDRAAFKLYAFDQKFNLQFKGSDLLVLEVKDLNFNDYLNESIPLIERLSFSASWGPDFSNLNTLQLSSGNFKIASKNFVLNPADSFVKLDEFSRGIQIRLSTTLQEDKMETKGVLAHTILPTNSENKEMLAQPWKLELSSSPKIVPEEMMANLFYSKKVKQLSKEDKATLSDKMSHFQFETSPAITK